MEATIQHLGEVQFEIKVGNHTILCDQPVEQGGRDQGPTPPEFLLAALGSCAAYYAAEYLRVRNLSAQGLTVRVNAEKAKSPARLSSFQIDIHLDAELEPRHREGLLRAAQSCLIHATLTHPPEIRIHLDAGSSAGTLAA
jgi:putative redox protein